MDDIEQPRHRRSDDDEDRPRRRPVEEDEDYPRDRAFRQGSPRPGGKKDVSVIGVIALVIGVISLGLSLVPCLGLFTLPLPIIGVVLALIGILISAIGQRDGFGVPVSAVAVNAVACVLPIAIFFGMCGLGMRGAQQAAQQAAQVAQAEQARQEEAEAEHRQIEVARVATIVGLGTGPDGPVLCLAPLSEMVAPVSTLPDGTLELDLDRLVREFERDPKRAEEKYEGKILRVQGTIQEVTENGRDVTVLLQGIGPGTNKVRCEFTNVPNAPVPRRLRFPMNRRVVIEGNCEGLDPVDDIPRLNGCKLVK
jgi:hypothetical protein